MDLEGNVYATGTFSGTVDFDPGPSTYELTAIPTPGTENYDAFTLKLDTDGNFRWAKNAGNLNADRGNSLTIDQEGNVFTTGLYIGLVDFDPGPSAFVLGSDGIINTFITKFDKNGNFMWAKDFAGNFHGYGTCIETDNVGNIYVSGTFEGKVDFDPGPGTHYSTSELYSRTAYLCKLDIAGNLIWIKENEGGGAFEVDANQQVFANNPTAGGPGTLSKYDINGNRIWTKVIGGRPSTSNPYSSPIRLDAAGNVYLTGEFHYIEDFDPGPGVYNLTSTGGGYNYDAFITRLDQDGNLVWVKQFGNYSEEHSLSIALDTVGNVYTTGMFNWNVDFDPGADVFELTSFSGGGIFIHKMSRCKNVTYALHEVNTCSEYILNGITYTESGTFYQTLTNASGCDSIITINIMVNKEITHTAAVACDSYTWNGRLLTTSGTYFDTLVTVAYCDSVVQLDLIIEHSSTTMIDRTICAGEQFEGYTNSGTYTDLFTSVNGCDSIRVLHLTVLDKKESNFTIELCGGQEYAGYSTSGIYVDNFPSIGGCDSVRTLNLIVHPAYAFTVSKEICQGEAYLNHSITGTYIDTLHTIYGCDSIQTTYLTVTEIPQLYLGADTSLCIGDSLTLLAGSADTYRWQDGTAKDRFTVKLPGLYSVTATNACGSAYDNIFISEKSCTIYFPTAFTPNKDGNNDAFGMLNAFNVQDYQLNIYNRAGQLVFESKNPAHQWDGSFKTVTQQSEVFIWQCSFKENNIRRNLKGTVVLIR